MMKSEGAGDQRALSSACTTARVTRQPDVRPDG